MHYIYCPECGTKLIPEQAGDDGNVPYCESCGKMWFDAFSSCVIILLANEYNEIAMLRQGYMSDKYWTFVSGFMTPGETAEEAAVREISEELGLTVNKLIYGGTYWFNEKEQLMHGFIAFTKKADFTLSDEVDEAAWVPIAKAPRRMFPEKKGNALQPLYRKYLQIIAPGD